MFVFFVTKENLTQRVPVTRVQMLGITCQGKNRARLRSRPSGRSQLM